jgi:hypothetical protein
MLKTTLSRRTMLRGAGIGLGLPLLNAMVPATARAQSTSPRRMFAICNNLGLLPGEFFPADAGGAIHRHYLKFLQDFPGLHMFRRLASRLDVPSDISFLTGAPNPASSSFRNTISLGQSMTERIRNDMPCPSLTLAVNTGARSLSWTGNGVAIPPEQSAASVFRQMFIQGSANEVEAKIAELDTGRSILDAVTDQVRDLEQSWYRRRARSPYFTSVRGSLRQSKGWGETNGW